MNSVPSENILKLRELTNQLCERHLEKENKISSEIIVKLKKIIADNKKKLNEIEDVNLKLMAYESMCYKLTEFLNDNN